MKFKRNWKSILPYKTQLHGSIEQVNEQFNAMNPVDQRKEIALDVLELLHVEGIRANPWSQYWTDDLKEKVRDIGNAKVFQQAIFHETKAESKCEVCARGACMLSTIRLGNEISPDDYSICDIVCGEEPIIKGFTIEELEYMENYYEGQGINIVTDNEYDASDHEWSNYPYSYHTNERLANLYLNVIYNGKFDYQDKTDYLKRIM